MRTSARLAAASLILVSATLAPAPAAQARQTYCSPSGDYCLGMFKRGGRIYLGLDAFGFRGRYRLCVTSPDRDRVCRSFRLRRTARGVYRSHVRWSRHFPHGQRGRYRAVWTVQGSRLPSITFRVRG